MSPTPSDGRSRKRRKKRQSGANADLRALLSDAGKMNIDNLTGRGRGKDKNEIRSRWRSIMLDADAMLEEIETDDGTLAGRPTFVDLLEIFQDAREMPSPEQGPGEEFVDNLNKTLCALLLYVQQTRAYLAKVHDSLSQFGAACTLPPLRRLLERGDKLALQVEETGYLADVIDKATKWEEKLEEMWKKEEGPNMEEVREVLLKGEGFKVKLKSKVKLEEKVRREGKVNPQRMGETERGEGKVSE